MDHATGPLLALLNNIVEIRADAFGLCRAYRRPQYKPAEDIGSWAIVFETMSLCCCVTNVAMICFVSSGMTTFSFKMERLFGWQWLTDPVNHVASARLYAPTGEFATVGEGDALFPALGNLSDWGAGAGLSVGGSNLNGSLADSNVTVVLSVLETDQITAWESLATQPGRLQNIRLWITLLVIEHLVLFARVAWKTVFCTTLVPATETI
eukprot:SAG22_NODE_499_length_9725_cov_2.325784_7_plen_209_part_00